MTLLVIHGTHLQHKCLDDCQSCSWNVHLFLELPSSVPLVPLAQWFSAEFCPLGDLWQCSETFLASSPVTTLGKVLVASIGWRPGILLNILQCLPQQSYLAQNVRRGELEKPWFTLSLHSQQSIQGLP